MTDSDSAGREERLGAAVFACLQALEAGEKLDKEELRRRYPDLTDELLEFLSEREAFEQVAAPLREVVQHLAAVGAGLAAGRPEPPEARSPPVPRTFGDYELLEEIGHGGMGTVYWARQKSLNRFVALKMIRAGRLASRADLQRFRNEAETVAGLDHPHIVPIHEVGELDGQLYFSMKWIEGGNLAGQLARYGNDLRAAARLLVSVAEAVHHAHQRGILHRDLKPSNILVDAEGQPHVTDFGLARRVETDSGLTQSGDIVGTPSYMAPEQTTGQKRAITTATDVYGLGAVLYALLAGWPPFRGDTVLETLEQVKERPPEPPGRSNPAVDRDLETICLKCLEKSPERRYGSAEALADDLRRWLAGEPIQARRAGVWERAVKWTRRRPAVTALLGLTLVAGFGLLAGILWHNAQLRAGAVRERGEADEAKRQRDIAQEQRRLARQAVDDMYMQVAAKWLKDEPRMTKVQLEFLEKAAKLYEALAEEDDPDPSLRKQQGLAYLRVGHIRSLLGHHAKAEEAFTRAMAIFQDLETASPGMAEYRGYVAESIIRLGSLRNDLGRLSEAREAYSRGLELREKLVADFPNEPRYQADLAAALGYVAVVLNKRNELTEARQLLERAIRHEESALTLDPANGNYRTYLCYCYMELSRTWLLQGKDAEADNCQRQAVELQEKLVADFPQVPEYRGSLAGDFSDHGILLRRQGKVRESEEAYRRAINLLNGLVSDFPDVRNYRTKLANGYINLGVLLNATGRPREAERSWRDALTLLEKLTAEFPHVPAYAAQLADVHGNLIQVLLFSGRAQEAEQSARKGVEIYKDLATRYPSVAQYRQRLGHLYANLAWLFDRTDRPRDEEKAKSQALTQRERMVADYPSVAEYRQDLATSQRDLAWLLATCPELQLRDPARAVELARKGAEGMPRDGESWTILGASYYSAGDWIRAAAALHKAMELRKEVDGDDWFLLSMVCWKAGDKEQARKWFDQAVQWMDKNRPEGQQLLRFRAEAAALLGVKDEPKPPAKEGSPGNDQRGQTPVSRRRGHREARPGTLPGESARPASGLPSGRRPA